MQKLSRTDKYRDYRNKLNNGGDREIVTKELKDLQDKIIFNEKRFGASSKTESDLFKGRNDSSYDSVYDNLERSTKTEQTDYLSDIFNELNKYKNNASNQKTQSHEEHDDYINKIKDIVYNSNTREEAPKVQNDDVQLDSITELEKLIINDQKPIEKVQNIDNESELNELRGVDKYHFSKKEATTEERIDQLEKDISIKEDENVQSTVEEEIILPEEEEQTSDSFLSFEELLNIDTQPLNEEKQTSEPETKVESFYEDNFLDQIKNEIENKNDQPQEQKEEKIAEFVEKEPVVEIPRSQLEDVQIVKADIQPTIPKHDHSKEFEEICMNVNSLAEEIDSANSFGTDQYVPSVSTNKPENSFEGIKQNVKKDLIGTDNGSQFFDDLAKKISQQTNEEKPEENVIEKKPEEKKIVTKSEVSEEVKEQFENTVSLQVDKLISEINSSKSDNISATDIIKDNDKAKKEINDQPGKTIAFEVEKKEEIPDNSIVLSNPSVEDASIRTMSFKTEDIEVEDTGKSNTVLNIILSILIVIAVGALGVIIYFFLITRGII